MREAKNSSKAKAVRVIGYATALKPFPSYAIYMYMGTMFWMVIDEPRCLNK